MGPIQKKILVDESNQPVAVQIDYKDWLEIEKALGTSNGAGSNGAPATKKKSINDFRGTIVLPEDPMDYQRRVREEWPP